MVKDDRLPFAPIFVENIGSIFGLDKWHGCSPFVVNEWLVIDRGPRGKLFRLWIKSLYPRLEPHFRLPSDCPGLLQALKPNL